MFQGFFILSAGLNRNTAYQNIKAAVARGKYIGITQAILNEAEKVWHDGITSPVNRDLEPVTRPSSPFREEGFPVRPVKPGSSEMSLDEAYEVIGVGKSASRKAIRQAKNVALSQARDDVDRERLNRAFEVISGSR